MISLYFLKITTTLFELINNFTNKYYEQKIKILQTASQ